MGTSAVGAMIVAGPEGFIKNQYRKFNIKSADLAPGDDYAMMREVLTRRFKRLVAHELPPPPPPEEGVPIEGQRPIAASDLSPRPRIESGAESSSLPTAREEDNAFPERPDLVLIDGGAGQLAVACQVFADLGVRDVCVIGVAKGPDRDAGREHFHLPGRDKPFMLEPRDPVLYFTQRLRDEAHRFAIGTHRAKRAKSLGANPLDEIPGIGPTRKRALLKHFGSAKAVSRAGVLDLAAVDGISAETAQKIYDFFHERRA
jgi:excinuclease ABC subunit C